MAEYDTPPGSYIQQAGGQYVLITPDAAGSIPLQIADVEKLNNKGVPVINDPSSVSSAGTFDQSLGAAGAAPRGGGFGGGWETNQAAAQAFLRYGNEFTGYGSDPDAPAERH